MLKLAYFYLLKFKIMSCCLNKVNMGCFSKCDWINTGLIAPVTGIYKIVVTWLSQTYTDEIEVISGDTIMFENKYNDSSVFELQVYLPNGNEFENGTCYSFTNHLNFNI